MTDTPELSEKGREEAEQVLKTYRDKVKAVAEEAIDEIYCKLLPWIESDAWGNYRAQMESELVMAAKADVLTDKQCWGKGIRLAILEEHKAELIPLLNQDLLSQVEELKKALEYERNSNRRCC